MEKSDLNLYGIQYVVGLQDGSWKLPFSSYNSFIDKLSNIFGLENKVIYPYAKNIGDSDIPIMSLDDNGDNKITISKRAISFISGYNFIGGYEEVISTKLNDIKRIYSHIDEIGTTSWAGCIIDLCTEKNPNDEIKKIMTDSFIEQFNVSGENTLGVRFVEKSVIGNFKCNDVINLSSDLNKVGDNKKILGIQLDINTKPETTNFVKQDTVDNFIDIIKDATKTKIDKIILLTSK